MKRALDRSFHPPAPMVPVRLRAPDGIDEALLDGKLDTGADLSAVPDRMVEELNLPPTRAVRAAGFAGIPVETVVYRANLSIDSMHFPHTEVLATRRPYIIVGRNILRHLVFRFDGPGERLELRRPR